MWRLMILYSYGDDVRPCDGGGGQGVDKVADEVTDMMADMMWPWWVTIPIQNFSVLTLAMEMMLEMVMGLMDMEVDKVADMV